MKNLSMRTCGLATVFVGLWIALSACSDSIKVPLGDTAEDTAPTPCSSDTDCKNGQFCFVDHCVDLKPGGAPCTIDNECASGQCKDGECDTQDECETDGDCLADQTCEGGSCQDKGDPPQCVEDNDCAAGEECNNGVCGLDPPPTIKAGYGEPCAADADCGSGKCTDDSTCGCLALVDCDSDKFCNHVLDDTTFDCKAQLGVCKSCQTSAQCGSGMECFTTGKTSVCILQDALEVGAECCKDAQCQDDAICWLGECRKKIGTPCTSDDECFSYCTTPLGYTESICTCRTCNKSKCPTSENMTCSEEKNCVGGSATQKLGEYCCDDSQCLEGSCYKGLSGNNKCLEP